MRRRRQSSRRERDRPRALNARSRAVPSRARASRRASCRRVERVERVAIVSTYVHHFLDPTRASKRRRETSRARGSASARWDGHAGPCCLYSYTLGAVEFSATARASRDDATRRCVRSSRATPTERRDIDSKTATRARDNDPLERAITGAKHGEAPQTATTARVVHTRV